MHSSEVWGCTARRKENNLSLQKRQFLYIVIKVNHQNKLQIQVMRWPLKPIREIVLRTDRVSQKIWQVTSDFIVETYNS